MYTFDDLWYNVNKYKLESCLKYHQLQRYFDESNGCGAKGGTKFPDTMWFVLVVWACIIHDLEWYLAVNYEELLAANERFDNNLKRITDKESLNEAMVWLRRKRIGKYITGVEREGTVVYAIEREFELPEGVEIPVPNENLWSKLTRFFIKN